MAFIERLIDLPPEWRSMVTEVEMKKPKHAKLVPLGRVSLLTRAIFDGKLEEPGSVILRYPA